MLSIRRITALFIAVVTLLLAAVAPPAAATTVRLTTSLGPIDVVLYDEAAPRTVANFLAYVNSDAFRNSVVHRSVPGFVIQGGGFVWDDAAGRLAGVPSRGSLRNEFSSSRSNQRGTIAMARIGGDPDSATSQWFINLANNGFLDRVDGGFTVFGEVSASSMAVVDAIAALHLVNIGPPFDSLPVTGEGVTSIGPSTLVLVTKATAIANNWQGLWWNAKESGWGMSLTQHGSQIFVAAYTYDAAGLPLWYVIPACPVTATGCSGDIYRVQGGTAPTTTWAGADRVLTNVGHGSLTFDSATAGTFDFTIDGVEGRKAITQQIFATSGPAPEVDYTDLWWNANESGWGISLTQQFGIIFAAWFTYDDAGNPVWYVVSNCAVKGPGCAGTVYRVRGGASLTAPWTPVAPAIPVGELTFTFTDPASGTMAYTINGVAGSRKITRQAY